MKYIAQDGFLTVVSAALRLGARAALHLLGPPKPGAGRWQAIEIYDFYQP